MGGDVTQLRWFSYSRDIMFFNTNAWEEDDDKVLPPNTFPFIESISLKIQNLTIGAGLWTEWQFEEDFGDDVTFCTSFPALKSVQVIMESDELDAWGGGGASYQLVVTWNTKWVLVLCVYSFSFPLPLKSTIKSIPSDTSLGFMEPAMENYGIADVNAVIEYIERKFEWWREWRATVAEPRVGVVKVLEFSHGSIPGLLYDAFESKAWASLILHKRHIEVLSMQRHSSGLESMK
ncbi:uncharacterized protein PAC_19096 [Phialocephala subalpina]|uniref:Uncharacterized protein n=1 Tax=Phialocephala subalpina TaxID=576137 RepID=A0A1L7XVZ2_9HELO|nr:uncharacterized protein PAC_19096 [Phialocephala subalpina]